MNQTRTFLLIAWLIMAFLVWDAWQKKYATPPVELPVADMNTSTPPPIPGAIPELSDAPRASASTPTIEAVPTVPGTGAAADAGTTRLLENDVLRLQIDAGGNNVLTAQLLDYRRDTSETSPPVELLSQTPERYFVAQTGWAKGAGSAPTHEDRMAAEPEARPGEATFVWEGDGIRVRRVYRLAPGSYELQVEDVVENRGATPWRGTQYRQLVRVPPPSVGSGFTNPEAYSFVGTAWFSPQDRFEKRAFTDFKDEPPLAKEVTGGWIAMLQHYFVGAWIPAPDETTKFSTATLGNAYAIRLVGPTRELAPGTSLTQSARLFLGPKLQDRLEAVAPGFGLTLDYGIFTILSEPLHWLLAKLYALTGNWGWAIVLLVVLIKLALFKLSESQYKSFAKMRRVQPRIEALKERYGEDRQKFQTAMMELYKKEKINPVGGCLPILLQFPIFIALYWVLLESVELRHAPWIGWIQNLTAPDPYFVLPALNLATMWLTQKLSPTPGMDPMQKRMMQIMPLVFGVLFAFFPAGLVLYWATNGALGLLQQWVITRRHGEPAKT